MLLFIFSVCLAITYWKVSEHITGETNFSWWLGGFTCSVVGLCYSISIM